MSPNILKRPLDHTRLPIWDPNTQPKSAGRFCKPVSVFLPNSLGSYVIHGPPFSMLRSSKSEGLPCSISILMLRGCLCGNLKPSFLTLLIFNWRTFSRRVTARWWRQWAKDQVLTNQNSINKWCQIVRQAICDSDGLHKWLISIRVNYSKYVFNYLKI